MGAAQDFMRAALAMETDDCIIWPFSLTVGYAQFWADKRNVYGHQFVCEAIHGPRPAKHFDAAHTCGVRACVNKSHLRWATRSENEADKVRHGNANQGERHGMVKLDAAKVRAVREAKGTQKEIADRFGISQTTVSSIRNRKTWRHI
jgi:hypothetical protein